MGSALFVIAALVFYQCYRMGLSIDFVIGIVAIIASALFETEIKNPRTTLNNPSLYSKISLAIGVIFMLRGFFG